MVVDSDEGGAAEEKEKAELSTEDDKDATPTSLLWLLLLELGKTRRGVQSSSQERKVSTVRLVLVVLGLVLWRFEGVMNMRLAMGFATIAAGATISPLLFLWMVSKEVISNDVFEVISDGGVVKGAGGRIEIGGGVMASLVVDTDIP